MTAVERKDLDQHRHQREPAGSTDPARIHGLNDRRGQDRHECDRPGIAEPGKDLASGGSGEMAVAATAVQADTQNAQVATNPIGPNMVSI